VIEELVLEDGCRDDEDTEQAEERRDEDDGETDVAESDAIFDGEDDKRPDEVELLLDAERPKMAKLEVGERREGEAMQVFETDATVNEGRGKDERGVVAEIESPETPGWEPDPVKDGVEQKRNQQYAVVKRKDAQDTASIEVAKAVFCTACVVEDARNEEAGEDEEDVDTDPAPAQLAWVIEIVFEEDEKDRNGSQAIECGIEALVFRQGKAGGLLFCGCRRKF
jgi:hypothetical protein